MKMETDMCENTPQEAPQKRQELHIQSNNHIQVQLEDCTHAEPASADAKQDSPEFLPDNTSSRCITTDFQDDTPPRCAAGKISGDPEPQEDTSADSQDNAAPQCASSEISGSVAAQEDGFAEIPDNAVPQCAVGGISGDPKPQEDTSADSQDNAAPQCVSGETSGSVAAQNDGFAEIPDNASPQCAAGGLSDDSVPQEDGFVKISGKEPEELADDSVPQEVAFVDFQEDSASEATFEDFSVEGAASVTANEGSGGAEDSTDFTVVGIGVEDIAAATAGVAVSGDGGGFSADCVKQQDGVLQDADTKEPAPVLVELSGAEVANDGNVILSGVDITIRKGEFVYLLGKVGSGKSSIIKTLIAELPLKKGNAAVAGYNLRKIKRRHIPFLRRKLGVIFQDFQLLMDRSVQDNLLFVLEATGWKKRSKMKERAAQVLEMVGLSDKAGKMPHQLSGGEQQRVAIARAFLNNPQVILADEPTGNLDEDTATDIMNLFMRIHAEQQPAVLMVTHNRELYKRYPGRVLICEGGSVREMDQEIEFNPVLE